MDRCNKQKKIKMQLHYSLHSYEQTKCYLPETFYIKGYRQIESKRMENIPCKHHRQQQSCHGYINVRQNSL